MKVFLCDEDFLVHIRFGKECIFFDTVVELCKKHYCKFDTVSHDWTMYLDPSVLDLISELKNYGDVEVSEDDIETIKASIYPPSEELKKVKFSVDKSLLEKFPPLKGKEGFENFQYDAVSKLVKTNRALLDVSCRHGKTWICCLAMGTLFKLNKIDKIFIVCRSEGVQNFKSEILFFLGDIFTEDDIAIVSTQNREIENYFDKKIIITNYVTWRLSCEYYSKNGVSAKTKKPMIKFDNFGTNRLIVLDEVQSINSYDSIQSHLLHLHRDYFQYRYGLSGTLGYNFLHWYSLAKFMLPNRIPYTYSVWRNFITKDFFHKEVNEDKANDFKTMILDKLTITYHDCIVQPLDVEKIVYCNMSPKMRKIYQDICDDFVSDIFEESNGKPKSTDVLSRFGKLASITSDPSLKEVKDWKFEENPKLEILDDMLNKYIKEENERVIVWSVHPQILNNLAKRYAKYKPLVIHGDEKTSMKKSERNDALKDFKTDDSHKLLLTNKVLSTSITITECSRQIYWDLPLSSDDINQSRERIRGPKQTKQTETNFLIFDNSTDLYIWNEIIQKKEKTRKAVLTKGTMKIEDFKNLLNPTRQYYIDGTKC